MKISIQNLKQGLSKFSEEVKPDFVSDDLAQYYPDIFRVDIILDKIEKDFIVKINLKTKARYTCDRCLDDFNQDIDLFQEQIYKAGPLDFDLNDDFVPIALDDTEIDLKEFLAETVTINHPIKMLCKDECKGICPGCGVNLNVDECKCDKAAGDPRWDELRKLIK